MPGTSMRTNDTAWQDQRPGQQFLLGTFFKSLGLCTALQLGSAWCGLRGLVGDRVIPGRNPLSQTQPNGVLAGVRALQAFALLRYGGSEDYRRSQARIYFPDLAGRKGEEKDGMETQW